MKVPSSIIIVVAILLLFIIPNEVKGQQVNYQNDLIDTITLEPAVKEANIKYYCKNSAGKICLISIHQNNLVTIWENSKFASSFFLPTIKSNLQIDTSNLFIKYCVQNKSIFVTSESYFGLNKTRLCNMTLDPFELTSLLGNRALLYNPLEKSNFEIYSIDNKYSSNTIFQIHFSGSRMCFFDSVNYLYMENNILKKYNMQNASVDTLLILDKFKFKNIPFELIDCYKNEYLLMSKRSDNNLNQEYYIYSLKRQKMFSINLENIYTIELLPDNQLLILTRKLPLQPIYSVWKGELK